MNKLTSIIEQSFSQYAGAVLQSRALVDVRDCLKPSARQIFYSMVLHKLVSSNPHKKTANAVGMAMADFYIHGDMSCVGIIMHAGQTFSMRYPVVEVKGNPGTQIKSGDWAAPRYTESRLSKISDILFKDIDKDTINEWRDNYDDTKQFPAVLPSKGFYNIVNGTMGIGIGLASSIPQFNLQEVNNALIRLIQNPDCSFDEIYCAPDFATGAYLLNESEVKESLRLGNGSACRLRAAVEYDNKERCFIVTEIPFGVYTSTICGELDKILEDEKNPGIEKYNDLTGKTPLIKIYLTKKGNPDKILKYLFKNTSLQSWYSINMTMLDNGRYPKVFGWKDALQAHINHEKEIYRNSFNFDLNKMRARVHILNGLLVCLASIDEVVKVIKSSSSSTVAKEELCKSFLLDDIQAKAVLDLKLSRLAHLEVEKLKKEKGELEQKIITIETILNTEELFNNELVKGWKAVSEKFGDARRTKILNIATEEEEEPIEIKKLNISITNRNNILAIESSTLYTQRRGGVGTKFKLGADERIISSINCKTTDNLLIFTKKGNVYSNSASELEIGAMIPLESIFTIDDDEEVCAITTLNREDKKSHIAFITKYGVIKKSKVEVYNIKRGKNGLKAIALKGSDSIINALFINEEPIGILTANGNFLQCHTADIRCTGRVTEGVKGITLNENDYVVSAKAITSDTKELVSISSSGKVKRISIEDFTCQKRATKGKRIQRLGLGDSMADFLPVSTENTVNITSNLTQIRLRVDDISLLSKDAMGTQAAKIPDNIKIIALNF